MKDFKDMIRLAAVAALTLGLAHEARADLPGMLEYSDPKQITPYFSEIEFTEYIPARKSPSAHSTSSSTIMSRTRTRTRTSTLSPSI